MKSTIKIALGEQNEAVIKMTAVSTDDIRDQLCRQWYQALQGDSNMAWVEFGPQSISGTGDQFCHISIYPLSPNAPILVLERVRLIETVIREQRNLGWTSIIIGGDVIYWENRNHLREPNPKTAVSPQLNREVLSQMSTPDLIHKIVEVFDDIDNWKVVP